MISAITMTNVNEFCGHRTRGDGPAAAGSDLVTVETDGAAAHRRHLEAAIETVGLRSPKATGYYSDHCAHPSHFDTELRRAADGTRRIGGIRANASDAAMPNWKR